MGLAWQDKAPRHSPHGRPRAILQLLPGPNFEPPLLPEQSHRARGSAAAGKGCSRLPCGSPGRSACTPSPPSQRFLTLLGRRDSLQGQRRKHQPRSHPSANKTTVSKLLLKDKRWSCSSNLWFTSKHKNTQGKMLYFKARTLPEALPRCWQELARRYRGSEQRGPQLAPLS